jgi:hypothetical protein
LEPDLKAPRKKPLQPTKSQRLLRNLAGAFASVTGVVIALGLTTLLLPKSLNPFYPLRASDPIGPLTKWKLQGLVFDPAACRLFLVDANVTFTEIPDRTEQGFCRMHDAVRMTSGGPPFYPNTPITTCSVAAGLVIWQRNGLKQAARDMMGSSVTRIDHLGTYNCRRQYGRKTGWASEHASANAIDIQGFTFLDGQRASVLDDWNPRGGEPTEKANFLRSAQDKACDVFKVVLGPEANVAHKNHFHLDMGPLSSCR